MNNEEINIEVIGLKQGEKMYEELMTYDESRIAWELSDMYIIPGSSNRNITYSGAKKTKPGTYSSACQEPLNINKLRALIKVEDLI